MARLRQRSDERRYPRERISSTDRVESNHTDLRRRNVRSNRSVAIFAYKEHWCIVKNYQGGNSQNLGRSTRPLSVSPLGEPGESAGNQTRKQRNSRQYTRVRHATTPARHCRVVQTISSDSEWLVKRAVEILKLPTPSVSPRSKNNLRYP